MKCGRLGLLVLGAVLTGCFPYQDDFSCRLKDNYGHCVDMSTAYKASVSGTTPRKPLQKGENAGEDEEVKVSAAGSEPASEGYGEYKQQVYKEMANLIENPVTPMVTPAKQMRTLFMPYAPSSQRTRIFMPRYVYSIIDPPRFIMGEYLYKRPELAPSLTNKTINIEAKPQ